MYLSSFASFCRCRRDLKAQRANWRTRLHRQQAHLTNFDPLMRLEASQMAAAFCELYLVGSFGQSSQNPPLITPSVLLYTWSLNLPPPLRRIRCVSHPCASLGSRRGDKKQSESKWWFWLKCFEILGKGSSRSVSGRTACWQSALLRCSTCFAQASIRWQLFVREKSYSHFSLSTISQSYIMSSFLCTGTTIVKYIFF